MEPFDSLQVVPPVFHGWFPEATHDGLRRLTAARAPRVIIEVGSWLGLSAIALARLLAPGGRLYCVDTWQAGDGFLREHQQRLGVACVWQQFLSNLVHAQVDHQVTPLRTTSLLAARSLKVEADLIYIDADHSQAAVCADVQAWWGRLADGGIMCGDDYAFDEVRQGIAQARLPVETDGRFWWATRHCRLGSSARPWSWPRPARLASLR